jgi:hypothetical protein
MLPVPNYFNIYDLYYSKTKSSKDVEAKDEESEEDVFVYVSVGFIVYYILTYMFSTSSDKSRDIPSKKLSIPNMLYDSADEDKYVWSFYMHYRN